MANNKIHKYKSTCCFSTGLEDINPENYFIDDGIRNYMHARNSTLYWKGGFFACRGFHHNTKQQ